MKTYLPILFGLLIFIPHNIAKNKNKETKKTKTPTEEPLKFVGCFKDSDPRDLPQRVFEHGDAVGSCVKTCKDMKYRFAGIQFAYLCFCGNLHGRFGQLPNGRCDSECRKKNDTQCGGEWANSIYLTGFEPLMKKKVNKHAKRDNVVMFDDPMQYQNADDRTFTIDVAPPNKHSSIPGSAPRVQRSYDSNYYQTGSNYGPRNQYIQSNSPPSNNQYGTKQYNSYNVDNTNNQYAATTKSNVPSNYSKSYQATNGYTNDQYGTKATSNNPGTNTQEANTANYAQHHFTATPDRHDSNNGYVISVTLHDDNTTTAGANVQQQKKQSNTNTQSYSTSAGYRNPMSQAGAPVTQNNNAVYPKYNAESTAQASSVNNQDSSQAQTYASSSYGSQPAGASSSAAAASSVIQSTAGEPAAQANAYNSQATAAGSSAPAQTGSSTVAATTSIDSTSAQAQSNAYGSQPPLSKPQTGQSTSYAAATGNTQTQAETAASSFQSTLQEVMSQASPPANTAISAPAPAAAVETSSPPSDQPKTPCTMERKMAQEMEDTFTPICEDNGDYAEIQCFEHKGYGKQCWCVDENGHEKKGTRAYGDETPSCSNQGKQQTQCQRERKIAASTSIADIYVPVCDNQGKFVPVQCFEHSTYGKQCWCVESSGQEIKGTRTHHGSEPVCDSTHPVAVQPMACAQAPYGCCSDGVSAAKGPSKEGCPMTQSTTRKISRCKKEQDQAKNGAVDIFIPDCKPNGQYNEVQCYTFPVSGKTQCWCVNADTGIEQTGTRLNEEQPNCLHATTTMQPSTVAARPPAFIVCVATVYKCCPDGVTAAMGPKDEGCPGLPTPPAPVTSGTSPTVPLGAASEICVTLRFKQVWYPQLTNRFGVFYLQLEKTVEKTLRDVYKIHPDFVNVHFSGARPETNPLHPSGPKALAVFFVLFFRRLVADPLATLRDSIDEDQKVAGRQVFSWTLRNLGQPYQHLGCPQSNYKPIYPFPSKPSPAPPGTIATSKPVVTNPVPITVTTTSPTSTANPCGSCLTPATCPTHCPPPVSTNPPTPPTTPPQTTPTTTAAPPTPPVALPPVTTLPANVPAPPCGPCLTPPTCPPPCPVTSPVPPQTTTPQPLPPQTTTPQPLPPQTTTPQPLPPQTTTPPPLPPQTTTPPPLPPQTTTPPPLPPQTTSATCTPLPCPTQPCPAPCPVTPPQTTPPPTSPTSPTSGPTTPKTSPSTKAPETTPTTKAPTTPSGPKVDGNYTGWTEWTECSATCDGGVQQRTRTCTKPAPENGGKNCESLGESFETKTCNTRPCPVDGGYNSWSPFEKCSTTCGGGQQFRSRECSKPDPMFGGQNCTRLGPAKETRPCNTFYCPIHGNFSDWSDYMACSLTCGSGVQFKMRTCTNPPPQHGGNNCSTLGPTRISRGCNTQNCPVDGGYSPFSKFSDCTATCGKGTQIRTRTCTNPPPRHGGDDCAKDGPDFETRECNTQLCPVDGAFTTFSNYSMCSKTCGGGEQVRIRSCTNPEPQFGGRNCTGTYKETKSCNTQPCPVDGGFGEWGNYSNCEVTCGGGTQMRMRTCSNPPPANGGRTCNGQTTETRDCNIQPCPVNGGYNDWSSYGPCSASCGGGSQQRTRECTNPPPAQGGRGCGVIGPSHETRNCSSSPCPIHGEYTSWTDWSKCSKPCGGGIIKRIRNCTNPKPQYGGKDCSIRGPEQETQECNLMQCPIHGNYSSWAEWSSCTVTCGGGEHMRSRTCTNPPPEFGGSDCTSLGKSTETTSCNAQLCPVNGGYSNWSNWSSCSVTCGEGRQYRSRKCSSPAPEFGGSDCSGVGSPTDTKACVQEPCPPEPTNIPPEAGWSLCSKSCAGGVQWRKIELKEGKTKNETRMCASDPCPIDGGYSPWSEWTQCSVLCGGGVTSQSRTCTEPIPTFGGQRCEEPEGPVKTKHCNMQSCPLPIRSCREFYERCHKRDDGLYSIYVNEKITASEMTVYCDMTQNQGGWTLIVTSATNQGWDDKNVKGRNENEPSLVKDYSILDKADPIKAISLGSVLFRLEAHERGLYGGIWSAPQSYSFTSQSNKQTGITEAEKFAPTWNYGPTTIGSRMPWLPADDEYALLTTSDRLGKEWFGTIVAKKPLFQPSPWMLDPKMSNPRLIWYWMKEASSLLKPPSEFEADPMCPSPVPGGYTEWGAWLPCPRSCGGAMQLRTRNCTSPEPLNGGADCSDIGPNVATKQCNTLPCPGVTVNGGYTPWSEWTECTATCGGGSQLRTRKCEEPKPQYGGKSCIDQSLGNEIETGKCNLQACPSPCSPACTNGGQCINNHCQCMPGLYEGTYCQIAICKKPCQNGGTCLDPKANKCSCQPQWGANTCEKAICVKYCKNGGTCTDPNTCTCLAGYSGSRCEKSICPKECVNGGRCVKGVCQCSSGYSGLACEIADRCSLTKPVGPCFAVLQDVVKQTTAVDFDTPCMTYLREVYQTCSSKSTPEMTQELCLQQCEQSPDVCSKVWTTESCPSWEDKYFYDITTSQCKGIRFHGCLGNHNLFSVMESCTKGCASGGNYGPPPTAVTPTVPSKSPPVPTSYYWYFLTLSNNQIAGSPPLHIKGSYRLIDLGYFFNSKDSWVEAQISNQDGLLDPDKLTAGLSIGLKIKLEDSIKLCQEPRYLIDTGSTSLQTRGLSIFVVGSTLSVQITTSKHIYKTYTRISFGRWKYLMITWKPSVGLNVYIDGEMRSSTTEPLSANNPPINVQMPNLAIGRKLGPVGGTCGKFYLSSVAVFKQFVNGIMVRRMYQFFWVNIVSQSPPPTFYISLNVTNKARQPIIVRSGDDMPSAGFSISANVIALITKTVPGNIATSFTVYSTDGQPLEINQKPSIEVNPSPTRQNVICVVVGKSAVIKIYHLFMRITNMARRDVRVLRRTGMNETPKEFTVKANTVAQVDIKVNSSNPVTVSVADNDYKPLFINYKPSLLLTPTDASINSIPLTITASSSPTLNYQIKLSFANYASGNVVVRSSDGDPKEGLHTKAKTVTKITKRVGSLNSIILTAVDNVTGVAVAINNAASMIVTPWPVDDTEKGFVQVNITTRIVKPKPQPNMYSIYLVVVNNIGRTVKLIPSDNRPFDGFEIPVRTIVIISKICNNTKPVDFIAVDPSTETMVLVNGTERQRVTPTNDGRQVSLEIKAPEGYAENPVMPSAKPAYYWSFYTLNNGTVLGSPPFSTYGNVQIVNDGIFMDGISAYLSTHMNSDDALVNPGRFLKGFAFGIKVKFPDSVKEYTVPKYVIDSGVKSLSSRGVSMYILEQRLVVELASSDNKWKTEAEISTCTNQWIYVMVSWSAEQGVTLYINGLQRGGDSGGLATNSEATPLDENLRIGRNLGDDQANFASFYLSSFAIFRQDLPAGLAFQVYKYYMANAIIQPSKMYYISLHVNNTLDKEVELVSNDGHPPGGVHLLPKETLVIRKEISASTSVVFTAEDVTTGGDLLINDEGEYVASPSEYKQQLTSITITSAGSSGKPAPRDHYYATLILKNKCKSNAVIISNDNHPSDGYRIAPGSHETLTKEVFSPGEISIRAFDPSTSRGLLINGKESYSVMPTREKGNPDALDITSPDDDSPSSSPPIPYSHYWSMNAINKGFVEGNPAFKVNGDVTVKDGGVTFDGLSAWLGATVDRESCLLIPDNCIEGFSLGAKLKFDNPPMNKEDRYLIDTGAQSTARRGISLFVANGKLAFVLSTAERTWMASTPVVPNKWFYLVAIWTRNDGLSMYIDNQMKSTVRDGRPNVHEKLPTTEQTNLNIGRNINGQSAAYNAQFSMASLVVFNRNIPTQSIAPVTSYFSKPLPIQPLTKYYIMLKITNPTTSNIILEPSDRYPAGGFTISHKAIAKIKKEVSSPSSVSFVARVEGQSNKYILLNGKPRMSVTPSESPLDVFDVSVSPKGETIDGPIEGVPEESGVTAPPVHPSQSWLLADLDGGQVPGSPALTTNGNVVRIDGGLEFDGVTAYLSGNLDNKQCLLDPDICFDGFSFGIKLKFMTNSLTVNAQRYVVDSGRTAKGRGVAVYIVMKELFVEIATSTTLYKGTVTVKGDRWLYLTTTWSRKTGMALYVDGSPTATTPEGITGIGYPISTSSPNFAIGGSASSNSNFCKVSIASFVTFNRLLSPNNVKVITNFFWIRGSAGEGKTLYVVIKVLNPLPITAVILPDDGLPNEGIRIPPNGEATIVKTVKSEGAISFSATNRAGNGSCYLNNRDIISVSATHSKDVMTRAVLSFTGVDTPSLVDASKIRYYKAPPVFARHSWSFNTLSIKAKKVPGTPPLAAYGAFKKGDGGLMFDGKTNWLGGHLQQPDCGIDPDQCISGFTLAAKLYLDEAVASYIEPKYLVDTGASSTKSRGFSMYVMGGKLYFELASATKVWMVTQDVIPATWIFVGITWSPANGLILYLNGEQLGADEAGRVASGRTINFSGENLVIGRDVTKGGMHYSKFVMASLLTIDSYLSPVMMRAVYSFYWRNAGTTTKGFVALRLRNQAGVDALVTTSDNIPAQGLSLPHLYPVILEKQIVPGSTLTLAATEALAKTPLLLNKHQSVSVSDNLRGYQIIVTKATAVAGVKYYFTIKIMNPTRQNVIVKSSDNNPVEGYPVKSATAKIITKSVASPSPITFTAVDCTTGQSVNLNGTAASVTITPTAKKGEKVVVCKIAGTPKEQYFISIRIINRSGKNVKLQLPLPGQAAVNVKKNVMMVVTKGTTSSVPVTVTATDEDNKPIAINGQASVVLAPCKTKQEQQLELRPMTVPGKKKGVIPDHVASVYYVTLRVKNGIGSKFLIAPTFKDSSHGFHFGSTASMQITKEYMSDRPVKLQVFEQRSGKPLLMNGRQILLVRPGAFGDPATRIKITRPAGKVVPPVTEHYVTLLVNNKLDREVRIIPSKGKMGGYIVGSGNELKVHMIIKGGPADPAPISFKAEDVETESGLEINEKVTPVAITPAEMSDVITHFNITAPAPSVKPQHSWSMSALKGSHVFGSPSLHAHGFYRYIDDGLSFDGTDTFMTTVLPKYDGLVNPDNSNKGLTVATKIKFDKYAMEYQDEPRFILDSGGHHKGKRGVSLYIHSGKLYAEVQSLDRIWTVSKPLSPDVWMYLTITWNKKDGLKMYRDSVLRADDDTGRPTDNSTIIDVEENLTVGRNIGNNGDLLYAKFDMSSLTTFGEALNQSDIDKAFIFFSSGASAKIFYAPIRITNEAGRTIIVKPSKGNEHGFHMIPRSTLEVTLMSMSTDGKLPNPVLFTAVDEATKLPLEINNSPKSFPVTPKESMQDFTTMVVAVPQPSVTPTLAWSLQKVRHGKVLGSTPTIHAFGELKEEDHGLHLDGKDSWLDAGDFKGKCLSDPQRCPDGFTVGLKVKFDDESSKYIHEPHYVVDTGGSSSNGRGFTLFVKNRKLYATVTQSNSAWRVEAPYALNKWLYTLVTWRPDSGLTLYFDGSPVASSEAVVAQKGEHLQDSFTHLAVGRNTAGPPYGNTKMTVSSLVFFEHHVRPVDAEKISMYYWGSVSQSSSDRFIKVRFDNRAGIPIRIVPSKGDNKNQGYTIQPHMNLQLSYVEKGPFNDIPVTFLAQNAASNERLYINGRIGTLRVIPSTSKTAVTEAIVASSYMCPSANGFFADPTSNARYIHCTDKNPSVMFCPDQMTWRSDINSCAGEGRESSNLYYYNVRFNNYAGNEAEIIKITGHKQRNLLPPGKALHVKFTTTKKHASVFRAIYADTGDTLRLNDYPTLQIYPSDDPGKVTEVTVSKPAFFYTIETKTGSQVDADTQANVYIKLIGEDGTTPDMPLAHKGVTHFKLGGLDKFRVEATDIGKIQKVYVRHDNSGESPNWYLEKVNIRDKNGSPYQFNVNAWLDKEQADHVTAKLLDVKNPLSGHDQCTPSCINNGSCIDGKCQCSSGYEGDHCQHALCDVPCLNGGTCISPDSNKCACPDGYTGKYCDKPVCDDYCRNGGTCSGPNQCTCPKGYVGQRCETSRCFPECMNGGQCIEGLCQCPLGHSGKYCEQVSICDIPSDRGPCFHEIFKAASKANKQNRTSACIRYLDDVLQSCTANNGSFTIGQCSKICEPEGEENVCKKIWEPGQCTSLLTKYTYDKDSGSCHPMLYNGCLGSRNSFDSIEECSSTCSVRRKRRSVRNSTQEKPKLLKNLLHKSFHHLRRHASYK